jgi:hypothetical protein
MTCEEKIKKAFAKMDIKELEDLIKNNKNVYTDEVYNWALECYNIRSSELEQNKVANNTSVKSCITNHKKAILIIFITALITVISFWGIFALTSTNKPKEKSIQAVTKTNSITYVGSKNSDKYHLTTCKWAGNIKTSNKVTFNSENQARARGYSPCKTCID